VGTLLDGTDTRDRLREEARMLDLLAPLSLFPAKIALFEDRGHLFLVQEYVPGTPLDEWSRADRGERSQGTVLEMAAKLVAAVRSVHQAGLAFRDLKPTNIMVTPSMDVRMVDPSMSPSQVAI